MEERVRELEKRVGEIDSRLHVAESNIKDMKQDITDIKSNTTWILRLIIGVVIVAILALIINSPESIKTMGGFIYGK